MMSAVSGPNESNGRVERPVEGAGVLAGLPRTRPQRASARRVAARRSGEGEVAQRVTMQPPGGPPGRVSLPGSTAKPAKPRAKATKAEQRASAPRPRRASARPAEPVPRQGFECETDRASGPVSPPGGIELLGSAAELLGELAKAGVGTGERLLRDVLSRLPGA
jgi:hypothetical protein